MTVAESTRAEIEQAIRNANESAKRVHDSPAYYEIVHNRINAWLDDRDRVNGTTKADTPPNALDPV